MSSKTRREYILAGSVAASLLLMVLVNLFVVCALSVTLPPG